MCDKKLMLFLPTIINDDDNDDDDNDDIDDYDDNDSNDKGHDSYWQPSTVSVIKKKIMYLSKV